MSETSNLMLELKRLIIDTLELEDVTPADIDPEAALFGEGLGLDSIDALELGLALQKQWYEGETPQGKEWFNTPIGIVTFRNNFKLPKGFLLDLNGTWTTKGHQNNIYLADDMIDMNASLYKSFLKDKLTVQLHANNILNPKQVATIYSGIRVMQNAQVMHRQVSLTLRYKFNTTRSKYKGTGAGESQKNRM